MTELISQVLDKIRTTHGQSVAGFAILKLDDFIKNHYNGSDNVLMAYGSFLGKRAVSFLFLTNSTLSSSIDLPTEHLQTKTKHILAKVYTEMDDSSLKSLKIRWIKAQYDLEVLLQLTSLKEEDVTLVEDTEGVLDGKFLGVGGNLCLICC